MAFMTPEIMEATQSESQYIERRLAEYNGTQVPVARKVDPVEMSYVMKEGETVIAGINAYIYHWGLMYISELFVDEKFRSKRLGTVLLT